MTFYYRLDTYKSEVKSYDSDGNLVDAASTPTVTITDPKGTAKVSAQNMTKSATGTYYYLYDITATDIFGTWTVRPSFVDATPDTEIETETFYVVDRVYTTVAKVAAQLRLIDQSTQARLAFTADTDPTLSEVERYIMESMDYIDRRTHHAWRETQVTDEYYDMLSCVRTFRRRDIPLHLKHRQINTMVSETDKIELWDGGEWKDLILTANGYTEGRGDDYWIDYEQGVIYFVGERPYYNLKGVRMSYKYGDSSVPGDIEEAATKQACINILETNDYTVVLPEGVSEYAMSSKVSSWKGRINSILNNYKEIITA